MQGVQDRPSLFQKETSSSHVYVPVPDTRCQCPRGVWWHSFCLTLCCGFASHHTYAARKVRDFKRLFLVREKDHAFMSGVYEVVCLLLRCSPRLEAGGEDLRLIEYLARPQPRPHNHARSFVVLTDFSVRLVRFWLSNP